MFRSFYGLISSKNFVSGILFGCVHFTSKSSCYLGIEDPSERGLTQYFEHFTMISRAEGFQTVVSIYDEGVSFSSAEAFSCLTAAAKKRENALYLSWRFVLCSLSGYSVRSAEPLRRVKIFDDIWASN